MEDESINKLFVLVCGVHSNKYVRLSEHKATEENEDQGDEDLERSLDNYLSIHAWLEYFEFSADSVFAVLTTSAQSNGGENIHNKVDP